jgi:hypothetical protein
VTEPGASLPSKNYDVFGPSPNVGSAVDNLARLAREGKPFPVICFFRTATEAVDNFQVVAWTGVDMPTLLAQQVAKVAAEGAPVIKGCAWGTFHGLPELPANHPKVGRGGYPGVTVYVTTPDARGYRTLRVSLREQTFDMTSGEAGIARWLVQEGWPTRARKR